VCVHGRGSEGGSGEVRVHSPVGIDVGNRTRNLATYCWFSSIRASAHKQAEPTAQELKKEVLELLREKERLESSLPSLIVIGPFAVGVETVRQALSRKRSALARGLLDHLASTLRRHVDRVSAAERVWIRGAVKEIVHKPLFRFLVVYFQSREDDITLNISDASRYKINQKSINQRGYFMPQTTG